MKRFFVTVLIVGAIYTGTYIWLRTSRVERWNRDGHNYVILPQSASFIIFIDLLHMSTLILPACVFISDHTTSHYHEFYETVQRICYAHGRQRWLSSLSLGLVTPCR
jgi:hypothetical protein